MKSALAWMILVGCSTPSESVEQVEQVSEDSGMTADDSAITDTMTSADTAPPIEPKGPLAGLPSAKGPHVAKIEALGDGEWLKLGTPLPDAKYGTARGRSWGGRALVPAPELRAAFFYGEGVHAMVKPDGLIMDDLFAYDINQNRWIAVYPGTDTNTFTPRVKDGDLHISNDNQLVDKTDQPIPVHTLIHAWDFLAYDTASHKFSFVAGNGLGRYYLGGEKLLDEGLKLLDEQRAGKPSSAMSPWFYDVATGRFEHYAITAGPPDVGGFANFEYVTSKKQYFYGGAGGVAFYDPTARTWTPVKDQGPRPSGYDHGGCYDKKRDRVYMGPGSGAPPGTLHVYDINSATWTTPAFKGTAPRGFSTNGASVFYDTVNDVVTVFQYQEKKIFIYDPKTETWSDAPLSPEVLSSVGYPSFNAFYDAALNAYFVYTAGDSGDGGVMWAYRYKK